MSRRSKCHIPKLFGTWMTLSVSESLSGQPAGPDRSESLRRSSDVSSTIVSRNRKCCCWPPISIVPPSVDKYENNLLQPYLNMVLPPSLDTISTGNLHPPIFTIVYSLTDSKVTGKILECYLLTVLNSSITPSLSSTSTQKCSDWWLRLPKKAVTNSMGNVLLQDLIH